MPIEIFQRREHPTLNTFYPVPEDKAEMMRRGGRKKKKKNVKLYNRNEKNINKISIRIGGKKEETDGKTLHTSFSGSVGGAPPVFRLTSPVEPAVAPPINNAIRNNVAHGLQVQQPLRQGVESSQEEKHERERLQSIPGRYAPSQMVEPDLHTYHGSSTFIPSVGMPNRPYGDVNTRLVAGRAYMQDEQLPRQRPTGRDNYVSPYIGQQNAPNPNYAPMRGQQPVRREQALDEEKEIVAPAMLSSASSSSSHLSATPALSIFNAPQREHAPSGRPPHPSTHAKRYRETGQYETDIMSSAYESANEPIIYTRGSLLHPESGKKHEHAVYLKRGGRVNSVF